MNQTRKNKHHFFLFALIVLLSITSCSTQAAETENSEDFPLIEINETSVSASGEVVPLIQSKLSFRNNAKNLRILVNPGDNVREGDLLVESSNLQQIAEVESAEARLADAESALDILKRNFASKIEQDAAVANVEAAKAALEDAQENFRLTKLFAPFSGKVIEVYANSFEDVYAGEAVVLLADMRTQVVQTTDLNEIDVKKIKIGDAVEISYDAFPETRMPGRVTDIREKSSGGSGVNYTVIVTPSGILDKLRWGMSAFVVITLGSN
jgi:multidrug efflux pump subunit AcrA (membrane-fusion protein)